MAERANYQGDSLGLSLNRDAVFALDEALERLRFSVGDRASAAVPLRLPDGRTLQLRLSLTDAGEIRDADGDYLDDDGIAHGDVTGDLAAHFEARSVLDAAARPSLLFELTDAQLDGTEPVALDQIAASRVDAAVEALPHRYGRTDDWVQRLRTRAVTYARTVLPGLLEREQATRRQVLASRDAGVGVAEPAAAAPAEGAVDRYAYRGSTIGGADLVERLIADGLALPAARDMDVDEVVWQVTEAHAVDSNDRVDVHDFPRKLSGPADAQRDAAEERADAGGAHVQRRDPVAGQRPLVADGSEPPAAQAPTRPRNRFDEDRRAETEQARERRGWAAQATADGRHNHAAYWTGQAERWDEYAAQSRRAAITEAGCDQRAAPDRDGGQTATAYASDAGRAAGSDGHAGGAGLAM